MKRIMFPKYVVLCLFLLGVSVAGADFRPETYGAKADAKQSTGSMNDSVSTAALAVSGPIFSASDVCASSGGAGCTRVYVSRAGTQGLDSVLESTVKTYTSPTSVTLWDSRVQAVTGVTIIKGSDDSDAFLQAIAAMKAASYKSTNGIVQMTGCLRLSGSYLVTQKKVLTPIRTGADSYVGFCVRGDSPYSTNLFYLNPVRESDDYLYYNFDNAYFATLSDIAFRAVSQTERIINYSHLDSNLPAQAKKQVWTNLWFAFPNRAIDITGNNLSDTTACVDCKFWIPPEGVGVSANNPQSVALEFYTTDLVNYGGIGFDLKAGGVWSWHGGDFINIDCTTSFPAERCVSLPAAVIQIIGGGTGFGRGHDLFSFFGSRFEIRGGSRFFYVNGRNIKLSCYSCSLPDIPSGDGSDITTVRGVVRSGMVQFFGGDNYVKYRLLGSPDYITSLNRSYLYWNDADLARPVSDYIDEHNWTRVVVSGCAPQGSNTICTATGHNLVAGQPISIYEATGGWRLLNGDWVVAATATDTFVIPVDSSAAGLYDGQAPYFEAPSRVTWSGMTAGTVTAISTSGDSNLDSGRLVAISGAAGCWSPLNGKWPVTVTANAAFTVPANTSGCGDPLGSMLITTPSNYLAAPRYGCRHCTFRNDQAGVDARNKAIDVDVNYRYGVFPVAAGLKSYIVRTSVTTDAGGLPATGTSGTLPMGATVDSITVEAARVKTLTGSVTYTVSGADGSELCHVAFTGTETASKSCPLAQAYEANVFNQGALTVTATFAGGQTPVERSGRVLVRYY